MVSDAERDRRHRSTRAAMSAAGVDVLLAVSDGHHKGDVRYLTNHSIWSQRAYAVVTKDAGPFLVVPMVSQQYWAKAGSWASDVKSSATPIREVVPILKSLAQAGHTLGISGMHELMPLADYEYLQANLNGVTVRDATELLQNVRAEKSKEELAGVRESADIASAGFAVLGECVRPGLQEFQIVAEVERVVRAMGARSTLLLTSEGPYLRDPSARVLQRGDFQMFSVELCGPSGYWVELGGMLAIGDIGDTAASAFESCQRAFKVGVDAIRVGRKCSEVAEALLGSFLASGNRSGIWGGHGIGLDTVEKPRLTATDETIISEGMVFGFHPHLIDASGAYGAYVADTVVATSDGPIRLGRFGESNFMVRVDRGAA